MKADPPGCSSVESTCPAMHSLEARGWLTERELARAFGSGEAEDEP